MKIVLDIPDDIVDNIDEDIMSYSNEVCDLGNLPASRDWAKFQTVWFNALNAKRRVAEYFEGMNNAIQTKKKGQKIPGKQSPRNPGEKNDSSES